MLRRPLPHGRGSVRGASGGTEPRASASGNHITRRGFVLAGFALFGASEPSPVAGVLDLLATDLSQSDTAAFLAHFDQNMPGYDRLRGYIRALSDQADVGSSIEIVNDSGDGRRRTLDLDWILEISGKDAASPVERRREKVRCTFERRGKKWIVTALDPIEFFAPPHKIACSRAVAQKISTKTPA